MAFTLDYDNGVDSEEFFALYQLTIKRTAERKKDQVENFAVALGSLFDKKIFKTFNDSINKVIDRISQEGNVQNPYSSDQRKPLSKMSKEERRAAMAKTMGHMNTLTSFLQSGGKIAPEGFC